MSQTYYVLNGGVRLGPMPQSGIMNHYFDGEFTPASLCCTREDYKASPDDPPWQALRDTFPDIALHERENPDQENAAAEPRRRATAPAPVVPATPAQNGVRGLTLAIFALAAAVFTAVAFAVSVYNDYRQKQDEKDAPPWPTERHNL